VLQDALPEALAVRDFLSPLDRLHPLSLLSIGVKRPGRC